MKKICQSLVTSIVCCCITGIAMAQTDTLILSNKNIIVGEVKSLDRGVLTIETPYSKNDFEVEWDGIKEIYTTSSFLIIQQSGIRLNGTLRSIPGTDSVIVHELGGTYRFPIAQIVFLKGLKSKFISRLDASVDVGITFTRANNLRQYNMNTRLGYLADKWQLTGSYTDNRSRQDSSSKTKRTEANIELKYFLQHDWFVNTSLNFLSNTEQALKLRTTGKIGGGKYLVHTNQKYWGVGAGVSLNNETFSNEKESASSPELYAATELNLFDLKDIDLLGNVYVYKSLSDGKRWRSDIKLDLKYDLPFDFYIKPGFTLNYDNQPAIAGNETDYVITFSIGWEL